MSTRMLLGIRSWLAPAVLGLFLASGCGARTSLDLATRAADDASTTSDAAGPQSTACTTGTITLAQASPVLMLVLDRSGSMGGHLGQSNGTASRWEILTQALSSSLPSVNDTMEIGAYFFPSSSSGFDCSVSSAAELLPAEGQVSTLVELMAATTPGGATPTALALQAADAQLVGVRAANTARALVLATDGAPNCNADLDPASCSCASGQGGCGGSGTMCLDEARTVASIASAEANGVPTYVIGIEDSGDAQFADVLDAMAVAGGRPQAGATRYYPGDSEADIEEALVAIRNQVGACTYLTSSVPNGGGTITVSIGGSPVTYDASGATGWSWSDRSNGQIVFAGTHLSHRLGRSRRGGLRRRHLRAGGCRRRCAAELGRERAVT